MAAQDSDDKTKKEIDPDSLREELADDILNGDADEALERADEAGVDIDDLDL